MKTYNFEDISDFLGFADVRGCEEFGGDIASSNGSMQATVADDGTIRVTLGGDEIAVGNVASQDADDGSGFEAAVAEQVECWEDEARNRARCDEEDDDKAVDDLRDEADAFFTDLGRAWVNAVRARIEDDAAEHDAEVE